MSERFKAFWLGIFILAALAILAWFLFLLRPSLGDGGKILKVRFSNIERVNVGTRVLFAGKPVGEVSKIVEVFDARAQPVDSTGNVYFYELILKIDSSVKVYNYDEIVFSSSGLMGDRSISIVPRIPPVGAPPAHEIVDGTLYATSSNDQFDEALNQVICVSKTLDKAAQSFYCFFEENKCNFQVTLTAMHEAADSLNCAALVAKEFFVTANQSDILKSTSRAFDRLDQFLTNIREHQLVESLACASSHLCDIGAAINQPYKLSQIVNNLYSLSGKIANGEGTLARFISDDSFYLQLSSTMGRIDALIHDINNYGLLFQYNKQWQRTRGLRLKKMEQLCTPCDFYNFFNQEVMELNASVSKLGCMINAIECQSVPVDDKAFLQKLCELIQKVKYVEEELQCYAKNLSE